MTLKINGFCDERFLPMRDAFIANFDEGLELGSSLALTHRGKAVVDLWAGFADPEQSRPWEKDTIVRVASTTKIMTTIAFLTLIDRGSIDLDETVAYYWPEFAQGGKEAVTVRDALTHQAGVPGFARPVTWDVMRDWAAITARIAAEPHWFGGRRVVCYHSSTYGFPIGELIRRIDGRGPARFFREEIAQKAGADFQIGLASKSDISRVAKVRRPAPEPTLPQTNMSDAQIVASRVRNSVVLPDLTSWEFQSSEVPASSGFGNGRSIARACAIIATGGELDGVRYLSRNTVEQAGTEQVYGECPLVGWVKLGLGFGLGGKEYPAPSPTSMHWGGFGGSWGLMDPKAEISLGYTPNNFLVGGRKADPRLRRFSAALERLLPTL